MKKKKKKGVWAVSHTLYLYYSDHTDRGHFLASEPVDPCLTFFSCVFHQELTEGCEIGLIFKEFRISLGAEVSRQVSGFQIFFWVFQQNNTNISLVMHSPPRAPPVSWPMTRLHNQQYLLQVCLINLEDGVQVLSAMGPYLPSLLDTDNYAEYFLFSLKEGEIVTFIQLAFLVYIEVL